MIRQTMPAERGDQLRNLLSGLALCELGDLLRWQDAFQESVNHKPSGKTEYIAQNVAKLDIGIFKDLLNAIALASRFLYQPAASAGQVSQFPDRAFGDKARPDHRVAEQVRQPATIIRIGLMTAPVLHVESVRQHDLNAVFKDVENWFPV